MRIVKFIIISLLVTTGYGEIAAWKFTDVSESLEAQSAVVLFVNACLKGDQKRAEELWDKEGLIKLNKNKYLGGMKGLMKQIQKYESQYVSGPLPSKSDMLLFKISNQPKLRSSLSRFIFVKFVDGKPYLTI